MIVKTQLIKYFILLTLIIGIIFPINAFAQSAADAIKALKKLQIQCETGISYRNYSPALSDATLEVEQYLESQEALKNPELADSIKATLDHYIFANLLFRYRFAGSRNYDSINRDYDKTGLWEACTAYNNWEKADLLHDNRIFIEIMIPIVWGAASEELKNAILIAKKSISGEKDKFAVTFDISVDTLGEVNRLLDDMKKNESGSKKEISQTRIIEEAIKLMMEEYKTNGKNSKIYKYLLSE